MNHLSEEQLILYYYGEDGPAEAGQAAAAQHLAACDACREMYGSVQRVLNVLDSVPTPERSPEYGAEVWQRIEHRLPARSRLLAPGSSLLAPRWRWVFATAAVAVLLVASFLAGRFYPVPRRQPGQLAAAADPQASERVLLVAVGDYLERSQMVLIELANANPKGKLDISAEQERASDLVSESRLYRQTAAHTGDTAVASVLDELDRVLLDIAHAPSEVRAADIERLRARLADQGILFKIRVLGSNLRTREDAESAPPAARKKL
jgi:hypothetical protein